MDEVLCSFCDQTVSPHEGKKKVEVLKEVLELKDDEDVGDLVDKTCAKCLDKFACIQQVQQKGMERYKEAVKLKKQTVDKMRELDNTLRKRLNLMDKFDGLQKSERTGGNSWKDRIRQITQGLKAYKEKVTNKIILETMSQDTLPPPDDLINFGITCPVTSTTTPPSEDELESPAKTNPPTRTSSRVVKKPTYFDHTESPGSSQVVTQLPERTAVKRATRTAKSEVVPDKIAKMMASDPKLGTTRIPIKKLDPSEIPAVRLERLAPPAPSTSREKIVKIVYFGDSSSEESDSSVSTTIPELTNFYENMESCSKWKQKVMIGLIGHMDYLRKEAEESGQAAPDKLCFDPSSGQLKYKRVRIIVDEDKRQLVCERCKGDGFRTGQVESNFQSIFDQITGHIKEEHAGKRKGRKTGENRESSNWDEDDQDLWLPENGKAKTGNGSDAIVPAAPAQSELLPRYLAKIETDIKSWNKSNEARQTLTILKNAGKSPSAIVKFDATTREISVMERPVNYVRSSGQLSCSVCEFHLEKKKTIRDMIMHVLGMHVKAFDCSKCHQKLSTPMEFTRHVQSHSKSSKVSQGKKTVAKDESDSEDSMFVVISDREDEAPRRSNRKRGQPTSGNDETACDKESDLLSV